LEAILSPLAGLFVIAHFSHGSRRGLTFFRHTVADGSRALRADAQFTTF